jgi:hypothetical protein
MGSLSTTCCVSSCKEIVFDCNKQMKNKTSDSPDFENNENKFPNPQSKFKKTKFLDDSFCNCNTSINQIEKNIKSEQIFDSRNKSNNIKNSSKEICANYIETENKLISEWPIKLHQK